MMRLHRASRLLSWQETYCQLETLIIRICLVVINSCKVSLCFTNLNTCIEDIATKPSLPANVSWEELSIQRLRPVNHKELVQSETLWRSILDLYGQLCPGGVYSICMDNYVPAAETNLDNMIIAQTAHSDYREFCRMAVLGLEDTPAGDQKLVHEEFLGQLRRKPEQGWYKTGLPWKGDHPPLTQTRQTA